jgi:LuxR family transcriptional regulator, maltose regulon positive regulatory protein
LKRGVPPAKLVTSLAHDDGSVAQYLFAEVLKNQPASVRRLLLRTSVTAELWPDLVDQLSGRPHARRTLAALAHANAFVEQSPSAPGGFRIHPLFREMLEAELSYQHPADVPVLHRICAGWYLGTGRPAEAIAHAIAARDWMFVVRLALDHLLVERLLTRGSDAALRGVEALPPDLPGAEAAVVRAAVAMAVGRLPAAADLVTAAAVATDDATRPPVRASAALVCVVAGAATGEPPQQWAVPPDTATGLLAGLPDDQGREQQEGLALVATTQALGALRGDAPAEELRAGLRAAAAAAQSVGSPRLRCRSVAQLAELEALGGDLVRAAVLAEEAESLQADEGKSELDRGPASATAQAWIHLERYALVEAREWLGRARARERQRPAALEAVTSAALVAVLQSRLLRLRHEYDSAEQVLRQQLAAPGLPRWVRERVVAEGVRLAFARGKVATGLALLDEQVGSTATGGRLRAMASLLDDDREPQRPLLEEQADPLADAVDSRVVRACQLVVAGNVPAAVGELERALVTAEPELLRWPFLDAPPQARRLLRIHPRLREPAAWLSPSSAVPRPRPAAPGEQPPEEAASQLTQELSEREREVLTHLAELLSTAEIAATMFISVNTVRTHIRSILRKLAVSRRNQAVRRARQLSIL